MKEYSNKDYPKYSQQLRQKENPSMNNLESSTVD